MTHGQGRYLETMLCFWIDCHSASQKSMNLGEPSKAYVDVCKVVVRIDTHTTPPQAVHHLLIFLLQCLDFLMALLVVSVVTLPAKFVGNCPVRNSVTYCPELLRLNSFSAHFASKAAIFWLLQVCLCSTIFNSLLHLCNRIQPYSRAGSKPGSTHTCEHNNQVEPKFDSGLTRFTGSM